MLEILLLLSAPLLLVSFLDWRLGVLVTVLVGFGQDVLRKLIPGEPVYLTVLVGVFFLAAFAGALKSGMPLSARPILRWHRPLRWPMGLFVLLVGLQLAVTFLKTKSVFLVGIGMIGYFAPLAALVLAFHYGSHPKDVVKFLHLYIFASAFMCLGVYLQVFGFDWQVLKSVGEGVYIYPTGSGRVELPSGFFRAAENAAWHGAAAFCLLVLLVVSRAWRGGFWIAAALGLFIVGAVLLTGRRKAIMEILMFLAVYGGLLAFFRRDAIKLALFFAFTGILAVISQPLLVPEEGQATYRPYVKRTTTVLDEATDRLKLMTVDAVRWSIRQNGFLGAGAGVGGQGAQHFGGGVAIVGGSAEGGMGKILAELGVPGLVLFIWLAWEFARSGWGALLRTAQTSQSSHALTEGFLAFLVTNVVVFLTASQIYGDPFVLLVLGLIAGFILVAPAQHARRRHGAGPASGSVRPLDAGSKLGADPRAPQ